MGSPFASDSAVEILNAPTLTDSGDEDTFFTKRTGTLPGGKSRKPRYTVEIRSEPLLFDFDPYMLGAEVAEAYRALISDQIRLISEPVKAVTVRFRAKALEAYSFGAPWAMERYSGGRIGPKPPNPNSSTKFNDSGRLAEGVFVRQNPTDKTFTVNLPTNRFNPEISGMAVVQQWFQDLRRLVPALDPDKAMGTPAMKTAIDKAISGMIETAETALAAKLKMLAMKRRAALKQVALAAMELAGG